MEEDCGYCSLLCISVDKNGGDHYVVRTWIFGRWIIVFPVSVTQISINVNLPKYRLP